MFNELGYDSATFCVIAVRSDVTRTAVNHHFGCKAALYREVVAQTAGVQIAAAAAQARGQSRLAARLSTFFAAVVGAGSADRSHAAFLITSVVEAGRHPELVSVEQDVLGGCREFVAWAVSAAIDSGELSSDIDTATMVEMLLAVLLGMAFSAGYVQPDADVTAVIDACRRVLSAPW